MLCAVLAGAVCVLALWLRLPRLLLGFLRELRTARQVEGHPWRAHWLLGDLPHMEPTEHFLLALQRNR